MKAILDAFAISEEEQLARHLNGLKEEERKGLIAELSEFLCLSAEQLEMQVLRILLERARPLLISQSTWSQPVSSSDPIRSALGGYLRSNWKLSKEQVHNKLLDALEETASNFKERRGRIKVTLETLATGGYRCNVCGFLFRDEDIEDLDVELPNAQKRIVAKLGRIDQLHPAATRGSYGKPRSDHVWPVGLYGSNREANIRILCHCCNEGKANYMSHAHAAPNVGVYLERHFNSTSVDTGVFYAVLARDGQCIECGVSPSDSPLTVRKRVLEGVLIPDNLDSVCVACAKGRPV